MKVYLEPGALPIEYAHNEDAGIDLKTPYAFACKANGSVSINTGVHVQIPHRCCGLLVSKSGLNVKHGITGTGLIDEGYTGAITVKLYNSSDKDYEFKRGDKICQLVILPFEHVFLDYVSDLKEFGYSDRGSKGFGSSGR